MGIASHRFDNDKRRRSEDHDRQAWLTPDYVLGPIKALLGGIGLDPCTESDNPTGADKFYSLPADGCSPPWDAPSVFCNPPYGEARARWVDRCIVEGRKRKVLLLIPSATDTQTFQRALAHAQGAIFVRGRLRFGILRENGSPGTQQAASHGSAILGYGVDVRPLVTLGVFVQSSLTSESREEHSK